ncbi:MAG: carbohydrate binding family 9 domain-containing protein, partial [Nonlabens sp.]
MKNYISTILLLLFTTLSFAQIKKSLQIEKTTASIKIDGKLTEDIWQNAQEAKDFIQFRPTMGVPDSVHNKTIVKMAYDDTAIYVSAYLYDDPSKIAKQFSSRDNFAQSDFFGFIVNPNNDAQNDTEFFVFASGTQADAIANPSIGEDFGWNA